MHEVYKFILRTKEIGDFGSNALTITFLIITFFAALGTWGLNRQRKKIKINKSGESVPAIWYICGFNFYIAGIIYGIDTETLAPIVNSVLRISMTIPILIGLYRYKGFKKYESCIFAVYLFLIALMIFIPDKGPLFLVLTSGTIVASGSQPYEMIKTGKRGVVSLAILIIFNINTPVWIIYSISIENAFFITVSVIGEIIFLTSLVIYIALYFKERKEEGETK